MDSFHSPNLVTAIIVTNFGKTRKISSTSLLREIEGTLKQDKNKKYDFVIGISEGLSSRPLKTHFCISTFQVRGSKE